MNQFKALLLAGGMAVLGTHAALAAPTLSYEVFVDGTLVIGGPGTMSTSGTISAMGALPNFSSVSLTVTGTGGSGNVPSPDLSSSAQIESSSTFTGSHTIQVLVTQTGLTTPTGTFNILNTINLNNLDGSVSSSVKDYIDAGNGAFAETTAVGSLTGTAGQNNVNGTNGSVLSVNVGPGAFSETQELDATFTAASVGLAFNDQLQATQRPPTVPEPASLALIGTALFGFGLIRRRRNRS